MKKSTMRWIGRCAGGVVAAALLGGVGCGGAQAADSAPATAPAQPAPKPMPTGPEKKYAVVPSTQQIDINHASLKKLITLPGIGEDEAKKIIAGRPYVSKYDLVTKKVLPEGLYISIRYRIIAIPDAKPKSKK